MKTPHILTKNFEVIQADCIPFLQDHLGFGSLITGIPDSEELHMTLDQWTPWFMNTVKLCLDFVPKGIPVMFMQIDRKINSRVICKLDLCMQAARGNEKKFLFDKVILRKEVGKVDLYHVTFMHLICFGDSSVKIGKSTPDVIDGGEKLWKWGIGMAGCKFACEFAQRFTNVVYDPFCGYGSVLKAANDLGMKAFGIDIDQQRVDISNKVLRGEKYD